jgi:hypothetical protein
MANNVDRILRAHIDRLLKDNAFSIAAAVEESMNPILRLDNLRRIDVPNILPIVADGLRHRARAYKGADGIDEIVGLSQTDFANIEAGFTRLIYVPAALGETKGGLRIPPVHMIKPELLEHIGLKRRKGSETIANADLLERFIEQHPEWDDNPGWTLGDVLAQGQSGKSAA